MPQTADLPEGLTAEEHPLQPFIPAGARILVLGSFPPPRARWSMDFYYPNPQNDFWRIIGVVFFGRADHFASGKGFDRAAIEDFCTRKGIALSDTAEQVIRLAGNASDDRLQIVRRRDITALLRTIPLCTAIVTTGQKATDTLLAALAGAGAGMPRQPAVGNFVDIAAEGRTIRLWRMPSSSRAYPLPLMKKAEAYAAMFHHEGLR